MKATAGFELSCNSWANYYGWSTRIKNESASFLFIDPVRTSSELIGKYSKSIHIGSSLSKVQNMPRYCLEISHATVVPFDILMLLPLFGEPNGLVLARVVSPCTV